MTELARTPLVDRRLFRTADLAAFELPAAPLRTDGRVTAAFCAVATDEPAGGDVVAA